VRSYLSLCLAFNNSNFIILLLINYNIAERCLMQVIFIICPRIYLLCAFLYKFKKCYIIKLEDSACVTFCVGFKLHLCNVKLLFYVIY
jgi:hypothetical protein